MTEHRYAGPLTTISASMLEGVAMRYRSVGHGPYGPERFEPGAFGDLSQADIILNVQHQRDRPIARTSGGTLRLIDSNSLLTLVAHPPKTTESRDALALVQAGVLQGISIEFTPKEERQENGVRVISRAELVGVALVDKAAYLESVVEARRAEARARLGLTLRALIPEGRKLSCECSGSKACHFADFQQHVVKQAFDRVFTRFSAEVGDDITAVYARYDAALGSGSKNTVRRSGPNSVDIDIPDDETGRALLAANESSGVIVRPYIDPSSSVFTEVGDTAIYSHAEIRSFVVSATDKRAGWPIPEIIQTPTKLVAKPEPRSRWQRGGRRVCL